MNTLWWLVIAISFLLSFVGLVVPILPAVGMVWLGVAVFHFLINPLALTAATWSVLVVFTGIILITDQLANAYLVKRYGGSRWSILASIVGVVVGMIFFPPFGILVVPFVFVFLTETLQNKSADASLKTAFATLLAFLGSAVAKALMQSIMIVVFLMDALGPTPTL